MPGDDPVRDLNNFLQGQPAGNLTIFLSFTSQQTGPNNQARHHGTYTFRGVVVGRGLGNNIAGARRNAAIQALQFFQTNGIPQ